MPFSATIPASQRDTTNATLEAAGFGPNCFSRAVRVGTGDATHMGLHSWDIPGFREVVATIPNVEITDGTTITFPAHASARSMDWTPQQEWFQNPIMIGDRRTHAGKEWESLVNYNVWTPPIAWREVVVSGYPTWVQPTGAHDAYPLNFIVTHNGVNYRSTIPANTTVPGENVVFGWWVVVP